MLSSQNVAIVKIPFHLSYNLFNNCLLFCSHGKEDFRLATVVLGSHQCYTMGMHMISGEEMHTLITFMVSVMASISYTVNGLHIS